MHRPGFVAACAALCMTSAVALAGRPDPASAEALFREGRARAEAGDWAKACPLFVESNRLDFALGTSMNLAACEEHIGKVASAWEGYRELLEALPPDDDRRPFVAESVARLERTVPRLTVLLLDPVDGTTVDARRRRPRTWQRRRRASRSTRASTPSSSRLRAG